MRKLSILFVMIASSALAAQPGKEFRGHFVVTDRSRFPLYYVTTVKTVDERETTKIILLRHAVTGQQLTVKVHADYKTHETTAQYTLDKKTSAKVRLQMPFIAATTLHETIVENREHKADLFGRDIPVTVESNGRTEHLSEQRWKGSSAGSEDIHARVKQAVDPALAGFLKTAATIFSYPDFGSACSSIPFLTDGATCKPNTALMFAAIPPDCAFDAELDMPCSHDQSEKAKIVRASGREGRY